MQEGETTTCTKFLVFMAHKVAFYDIVHIGEAKFGRKRKWSQLGLNGPVCGRQKVLLTSSSKGSSWKMRIFQCFAASQTSFVVATSVWSCPNAKMQVGQPGNLTQCCHLVVFSWIEGEIGVAEVASGVVMVEKLDFWCLSAGLVAGMFRVVLV